jgi:hypothetical protein
VALKTIRYFGLLVVCRAVVLCASAVLVAVSDASAREPQTGALNLVRNGDFSAGTDFWQTDGADVIRDPNDPTRRVLRVPMRDGVGAISQNLSLPNNTVRLDFSCRLRALSATKDDSVLSRVRLYDANGNSLIIADKQISANGKWYTVKARDIDPKSFRDRLLLEAITGQEPLLVADVFLARAR